MRLALENTGNRRLAEASPHDNVWGIGLSAFNPRAASPASWLGQNLSRTGLRARPGNPSPGLHRAAL